jgi:hypothetical protein
VWAGKFLPVRGVLSFCSLFLSLIRCNILFLFLFIFGLGGVVRGNYLWCLVAFFLLFF